MAKYLKSEKGFTLIEMLIVLAVMAILAAVVIPNVTGFLSQGKDNAYKSDQRILQAAVDAWRGDPANRQYGQWPVVTTTNTISLTALVNGGYLSGLNAVASADTISMTDATNSPSGEYEWGIDEATGVITSTPFYTQINQYP